MSFWVMRFILAFSLFVVVASHVPVALVLKSCAPSLRRVPSTKAVDA